MKKNNSPEPSLKEVLQTNMAKQYRKAAKREQRFAVVYTRVSSQEQAENNSSLEIQLKLCREYAQRQGLFIKEYFGGTYESAKTDGRKEFQRMLSFVKKDRDIAYIIVYNYDRFSRTGPAAAQLSDELRKLGIMVKSVTQDIDSSTPSGRLQENFFHLFNNYDNQQRANRTSTNTREVMLKGYWPYATPLGYQNLKPKHRACDHQYIITPEGELLKKAFHWKADGVMTNKEIIDKLSVRGLRLTEKNFRWVISNVFYAGYVTGKLVEGKLINGQHPPLIDLKTFLAANNLLKNDPIAGIVKHHQQEELPLKIFTMEENSLSPFTGYLKKGNWYYKARTKGVGVNVSAKKLNQQFEGLLKEFEYKKEYKERLKKALLERLKNQMAESLEQGVQLKKRLSETKNLLEKVEERYAIGEISRAIYEKVAGKYEAEMEVLEKELREKSFDSSNLEKAVEKGLQMAQNLSQLWALADFVGKQRLQYLIFPEVILYSKENEALRTQRINALFEAIGPLKQDYEENKKGNSEKNCLLSYSVPRTGFEPAHLAAPPPEDGASTNFATWASGVQI